MTTVTRRAALCGGSASLLFAAGCVSSVDSDAARTIDARANASMEFLEATYPATRDLRENSSGQLIMPLVTEAGAVTFGGSYGRGVLRIDDVSVDYYSAAQAAVGLQIGAQQYAHVLYFMTDEALNDFRSASGWVAGADLSAAVLSQGEFITADTATTRQPITAVVFGQAGLLLGATLQGTKYTRISA